MLSRDKVGVLGFEIYGKCMLAAGSINLSDFISDFYKIK